MGRLFVLTIGLIEAARLAGPVLGDLPHSLLAQVHVLAGAHTPFALDDLTQEHTR
jgi:hypothetical protein